VNMSALVLDCSSNMSEMELVLESNSNNREWDLESMSPEWELASNSTPDSGLATNNMLGMEMAK
jgi:hypothetical protein